MKSALACKHDRLKRQCNECYLEEESAELKEALKQILGWRELRSSNDFPVERIEEIARLALQGEG